MTAPRAKEIAEQLLCYHVYDFVQLSPPIDARHLKRYSLAQHRAQHHILL